MLVRRESDRRYWGGRWQGEWQRNGVQRQRNRASELEQQHVLIQLVARW
jgi:hypothetical protein